MGKRTILLIALNELDKYELQGIYLTLAGENALYLDSPRDLIQKIIECCSVSADLERLLLEKGQKIFDLHEEYQQNKRKISEELHKSIKNYFNS